MPPQSGLGELANRFVPGHAPLDLGGGRILRLEAAVGSLCRLPTDPPSRQRAWTRRWRRTPSGGECGWRGAIQEMTTTPLTPVQAELVESHPPRTLGAGLQRCLRRDALYLGGRWLETGSRPNASHRCGRPSTLSLQLASFPRGVNHRSLSQINSVVKEKQRRTTMDEGFSRDFCPPGRHYFQDSPSARWAARTPAGSEGAPAISAPG